MTGPLPAGPTPDYLSLLFERLVDHLIERAVDTEIQHRDVLTRLDKIMSDQSLLLAKLAELDTVIQGFEALTHNVGAAAVSAADVEAAHAAGEQDGLNAATELVNEKLADAQAALAALQAQYASLTTPAAPVVDPAPAPVDAPVDVPVDAPVDPAPVDAPVDPAPADAPVEVTDPFVLGHPGA